MAPDQTTDVLERRAAGEELGQPGLQELAAGNPATLETIDIAWLLWNHRTFVAKWVFWGIVLSAVIAFLLPKSYTATAQLMPPDFGSTSSMIEALPALGSGTDASGENGGAGSGAGILGIASKLLGMSNTSDLIVGIAQSRTIEDDIIQRFGLMKVYSSGYLEDARRNLEKQTKAKADPETGIISISVEDKDPKRAAAMAQAYVDELNKVLADVNSSSAHRERLFIETRLAEVKSDLDASAKDFSVFASQNTAIDIPEQAKAEVTAAADLQAQLIAAQSMLRGLQQIYTDSNARVRQMQAQVDELQRQLSNIGGKDVKATDGATLSAGELYPSIRQLPLLGVKYLDLYRRNKIDESVFELLSKELEVAKMEEARDVPTVQVLDAPVAPQKKTGPHRLWIIIGGGTFCFLIAAAWILGGEYWERTDPHRPWRIFAEEVLLTTRAHTWDSAAGQRIRARFSRITPNARRHTARHDDELSDTAHIGARTTPPDHLS